MLFLHVFLLPCRTVAQGWGRFWPLLFCAGGLLFATCIVAPALAAEIAPSMPAFDDHVVSGGVRQPGWRVSALRLGANEGFDRLVLEVAPPASDTRKGKRATPSDQAPPAATTPPGIGSFWVEGEGAELRIELPGYRWGKGVQASPHNPRLSWIQRVRLQRTREGVTVLVQQPAQGQFRAFVLSTPRRLVVDVRAPVSHD